MTIPALESLLSYANNDVKEIAAALIEVWDGFSKKIDSLPFARDISEQKFTVEDYQRFLRNLRAQVADGASWIARAASSFDAKSSPMAAMIRDIVIQHAYEEKGDYRMLDSDYQACGGSYHEIINAKQNIATYALSNFIMYEASKPNPYQVLGAIFIIEGMGTIKAGMLAQGIKQCPGIPASSVSFLEYHNKADEQHFATFAKFLTLPGMASDHGAAIVKLAKTVALLYSLQFENLDSF